MAIKIIDGFESETNYGYKGLTFYRSGGVEGTVGADSNTKKNGSNSMRCTVASGFPYYNARYWGVYNLLPSDSSIIVCGFYFNLVAVQTTSPDFFRIDHSDGSRTIKIRRRNDNGKLEVYNNGTLVGTSINTITLNTWYHIQVKVISDSTNGIIALVLNNIMELYLTGLVTTSNGGNKLNRVLFTMSNDTGSTVSGPLDLYFDDVYVLDQTAPLNDFLGICRVVGKTPSVNGSRMDFTASGAANALDCIDEVYADAAQNIYTYYKDSTGFFDFSNFSIGGTIKAISIHDISTRSVAGFGLSRYRMLLRSYDNRFYVGDSISLNIGAWTVHNLLFESNPMLDTTWDSTNINNFEMGFKITEIG